MGGFRAAGLAAAGLTAIGVVGVAAPACADTTVTVQGTSFPDPARAALSFVGCGDLYQRTDEDLAPSVGLGPGQAPSGSRSLGWDLAGGNAVGVVFPVPSVLAATTAALDVNAAGQASGVAYAGYQQPSDTGTSLLWIGRAPLATPGGAWQDVEATGRAYVWTHYDMATRRPVGPDDGVSATVAEFAASHGGDGPGFYTIGFGCDGTPFSMDTLRVGTAGDVTTYDAEGLRTSVTITSQHSAGGDVTIAGRLTSETGDAIPFATMILERRDDGGADWRPVQVVDVRDGVAVAKVRPEGREFYRWRFVERPLAEGSTSRALVLDVDPTPDEPTPPDGQPSPTASPPVPPPTSTSPADTPSQSPSPSPSSSSEPPTLATPSVTPSPSDIASSLAATVSATVSAGPGDPVEGSTAPTSTP